MYPILSYWGDRWVVKSNTNFWDTVLRTFATALEQLAHRVRRWPNIKQTVDQSIALAGNALWMDHTFLVICLYTTVGTACSQSVHNSNSGTCSARWLPTLTPDDWREMPSSAAESCDLGSTRKQQQTDWLLLLPFLPPILTCPAGLGLSID